MIILKEGGLGKDTVSMFQVHGNTVATVAKNDSGRIIENCDGLITNDPNIYLSVSVADCIPLALYDPVTKSIGLLHAGWRGLNNGIIKKTVGLMAEKFSTNPGNLLCEIGPHICQRHYEIKKDVSELFSGYPKAVKKVNGSIFLNLSKIAKIQLLESGLSLKNIKVDRKCTFENVSLPSYRRGDFKKRIHYLLKIPGSS